MLTGDKYSTALQIATSCNLKNQRSLLCSIEGADANEVGQCLTKCKYDYQHERSRYKDMTVIVAGDALEFALSHFEEEFVGLCLAANSVICCRVTPAQKAQVRCARMAGY